MAPFQLLNHGYILRALHTIHLSDLNGLWSGRESREARNQEARSQVYFLSVAQRSNVDVVSYPTNNLTLNQARTKEENG